MLDETPGIDLNRAGAAAASSPPPTCSASPGGRRRARRRAPGARVATTCRARRDAALAAGLAFALGDPGVRLEAPVPRPGKVLALGVNYKDHSAEANIELPKRPLIFSKVSSCITGPGAPIHLPKASPFLDYEGELCLVIGKRARHTAPSDALAHVAGYMIGNDVSVRDWQFHSPTWMMGKSFDTHGDGAWLVTRDEIPAERLVAARGQRRLRQAAKSRSSWREPISGTVEGVTLAGHVISRALRGVAALRDPRATEDGRRRPHRDHGLGVLEKHVIASRLSLRPDRTSRCRDDCEYRDRTHAAPDGSTPAAPTGQPASRLIDASRSA